MMQRQVICAQEQVCQVFRLHKKFIEKEITHSLNQLTTQRKQQNACNSLQAYIDRLATARDHYQKLLETESDLSEKVI